MISGFDPVSQDSCHDRDGVTLAELLVAMLVFSFVVMAGFVLTKNVGKFSTDHAGRSRDRARLQLLINQLEPLILNLGYDPMGTGRYGDQAGIDEKRIGFHLARRHILAFTSDLYNEAATRSGADGRISSPWTKEALRLSESAANLGASDGPPACFSDVDPRENFGIRYRNKAVELYLQTRSGQGGCWTPVFEDLDSFALTYLVQAQKPGGDLRTSEFDQVQSSDFHAVVGVNLSVGLGQGSQRLTRHIRLRNRPQGR